MPTMEQYDDWAITAYVPVHYLDRVIGLEAFQSRAYLRCTHNRLSCALLKTPNLYNRIIPLRL